MDNLLKQLTDKLRNNSEGFINYQIFKLDENDLMFNPYEIIPGNSDDQLSIEEINDELLKILTVFKKEIDFFNEIINYQPAGLYRIRVSRSTPNDNTNWASSENPPYVLEFANLQLCKILGITLKEFNRNPFILADLICEEDMDSFVSKNIEANAKISPFNWEGRVNVDGKLKWVSLYSIPKLLNSDEICWTGVICEITKSKLIEDALEESEKKYRLLFLNNPQPMLIADCETFQFLEVNESAINHYGYSKEEFLSMNAIDIRYSDDIQELSDDFENIKSGQKKIGVRRHKKKNGDIIFVEITGSTINYNGKLAIHYLINDVTERRKLEDTLVTLYQELENRVDQRTLELLKSIRSIKLTEQKFRTVVDFTYNWEYWKSQDNVILYMSPSVERITGYPVEEFIKEPELINSIVYKDDLEGWEKHRKERYYYSNSKSVLESVFRIIRKDGAIRYLAHTCRIINDENNMDLGVRVTNRDITESVEIQNKLHRVTVDVSEQERNSFSRELHDGLGPLLSTIKLYIQLLSNITNDEKRKNIEDKCIQCINSALQTTRELARGLSSQFLSHTGYVIAMNEFIDKIKDSSKVNINFSTNCSLRFNPLLELSLYRITTELIKNTIVHAEGTDVKIEFLNDDISKCVSLMYADNGKGFDLESVQSKTEGLGLNNIQQRVKALNGVIDIETKPGNGTKVFIQFSFREDQSFNYL